MVATERGSAVPVGGGVVVAARVSAGALVSTGVEAHAPSRRAVTIAGANSLICMVNAPWWKKDEATCKQIIEAWSGSCKHLFEQNILAQLYT
jgi:hypothetical protein